MSFAQSPIQERPNIIRIVKLSDGVAEAVVVASETFEGIQSHFTNRTQLCGGQDCPLCFEGRPTRYLGFVVVQWRLGRGLLRLTSGPATQLMGMQPHPGLALTIMQKSRRSPIQLRREGFNPMEPAKVVTQLELLNCLSHLFGLGPVDFDRTYDENVDDLRVLACKQATRATLPFDRATG